MSLSNLPKSIKLAGVAAALAATFGAGYYYRENPSIATAQANPNVAATPSGQVMRPVVGLPDFSGIVAEQGAAVVNISVTGAVKTANRVMRGFPQLDPDDPFFDFFRRFQPEAPDSGDEPMQALGSGFIVSPDGVVLTNAHVVADADEVTVKLTDRREFKAKVIGLDKPSDVAVLKIDAKNLPTVKIGQPQNSKVGEWVVAIGSPFGFENSVTAGIVSAKSRSLPDEGYVPFLQTDVAINPGNSGGPLFNMSGEVIGINSQIYSRSGGYQGLSFAIPIDVAMKVEHQLLDHGKVSRGRLGVVIQPVDQQLAQSFGLDKPVGALVSSVEKDSPAEKAGVEPGDVITKINGKTIDRSAELPPLVADIVPGSSAKLEIWHHGKTREVSIRVGEMKPEQQARAEPESTGKSKLGIAVRPLTDEEARQADTSNGVMVDNVGDGPAAKAGIRPGDIIVSVNGEKVATPQQLRSLIDKYQKHLALLVIRDGSKQFVPVPLG
jgi:serine protease Do